MQVPCFLTGIHTLAFCFCWWTHASNTHASQKGPILILYPTRYPMQEFAIVSYMQLDCFSSVTCSLGMEGELLQRFLSFLQGITCLSLCVMTKQVQLLDCLLSLGANPGTCSTVVSLSHPIWDQTRAQQNILPHTVAVHGLFCWQTNLKLHICDSSFACT